MSKQVVGIVFRLNYCKPPLAAKGILVGEKDIVVD